MTKTTYICDACGAEVDSATKIAHITIGKINSPHDSDFMDLCASCRKNLMVFINGMKKK